MWDQLIASRATHLGTVRLTLDDVITGTTADHVVLVKARVSRRGKKASIGRYEEGRIATDVGGRELVLRLENAPSAALL